MKKTLLAAVAVAGLMLAACDPQTESPTTIAPETPVVAAPVPPTEAEAVETFAAALTALDSADAGLAAYAPGAVVFMPDANETVAAAADVQAKRVAQTPSTIVNTRNLQILDADTFVVSGLWTRDLTVGGKATYQTERYTLVFQKQADGAWLVAHEQRSKPPVLITTRLAPHNGALTTEQEETPPLGGSMPATK
jgi:ketosteroid isomerase-like protein